MGGFFFRLLFHVTVPGEPFYMRDTRDMRDGAREGPREGIRELGRLVYPEWDLEPSLRRVRLERCVRRPELALPIKQWVSFLEVQSFDLRMRN